jgi:ABC-type Fe3+/spermidine/putrescine transport system ATPase subunit
MLFPHLTVEANIGFGLRSTNASPLERSRKVQEYASLLNISGLLRRYPGTLSGGERQRTAIARALAIQPRVLLLDEPLNALDAGMRNVLQEELKRIPAMTGTTIVHVTHSFEEVFSLGDRVAVMDRGSIVQVDRPDGVFGRPASEFVARFTGTENIFTGESRAQGDRSLVTVNGVTMTSATVRDGHVSVCIRPENIRIMAAAPGPGMPNLLEGVVERVINGGTFARLTIDAGIPLVVMMMRKDLEGLGAEKDQSVFITFDPSSVYLI